MHTYTQNQKEPFEIQKMNNEERLPGVSDAQWIVNQQAQRKATNKITIEFFEGWVGNG